MTGPDPAVAAVRRAVRGALGDLPAAAPVGVAFSGGPDSLALLAAAAFERAEVHALVVDHSWHAASGAVTDQAVETARALGAVAHVLRAPTERDEAAARTARYAVLDAARADNGLATVLLGHTRDDQAETVLLALARGSGARSLAGMPAARPGYRRPLLELPRAITLATCAALGLTPYADPANADPSFARVRVRHTALPALAAALGQDPAPGLARSARLLRADADLLDALADEAAPGAAHPDGGLDAAVLAGLPEPLRRRLLHRLAPALTSVHVSALEALVSDWHGQGAVGLPGGVAAIRRSGRIHLVPADAPDQQAMPESADAR